MANIKTLSSGPHPVVAAGLAVGLVAGLVAVHDAEVFLDRPLSPTCNPVLAKKQL